MDKEFAQVCSLLGEVKQTARRGKTYTTGTIGSNEVVMVQCGIGKVNAAMWTTDMVNAFSPDGPQRAGSGGGNRVVLPRRLLRQRPAVRPDNGHAAAVCL